ncbi:MAG: response regulator [Magnetococcales bacterium]|nr:response regulator [Magnetococcales bacterium]
MSRILLIDDDVAIRDIACKVLQRSGHELQLVASAEEGLQCCAASPFHLVITDLSLPGMPGSRFAEIVRERYPHVKILIFSGLPPDSPGEDAQGGAGLAFLAKPFRPKELLSAVEEILLE